jgi:hypothetical protein
MKKAVMAVGALAVLGGIIFAAGQMSQTSTIYASGKVVLSPELTSAAKNVHTLFLIVGYPDRPRPYGALRKTLSSDASGDVYSFDLTNESVQRMEQIPWPETFKIKARLDRDGSAGPDQPGDLVGEITGVQQGAKDVVITIDREVP